MADDSSQKEKIQDVVDEIGEMNDLILFSMFDCSSPRQMELFWVDSPLEYQYLFLTHDDNRPDGEIIINGPYSGSEFLGELEDILLKPRWQQPIDESTISRFDRATDTPIDISTRRDIVVSVFQGIEQNLGGELFLEPETRLKQTNSFEGENGLIFLRGNLFELDSLDELLKNTFGKYLEEDAGEKQVEEDAGEKLLSSRADPNALGTYIWKPVWVGDTPNIDFEDRILINPPREYDTVHSEKIGGREVFVTQDGFIGVDEIDDEPTVLEILNVLFGTSILVEHPFEAATQDDLIEVVVDEDGNVSSRRGDPSLRRRHATPEPVATRGKYNYTSGEFERTVVDEDYLGDLCGLAREVYENDELKERVNSTLQAYTHHVNGEYTQAFLLAWISIEQYINTELDKHLKKNKDVNSDRRQKMQRGGHWSASHLIELMEVSNCLSESRYDKITQMRRRRNEMVHETDSATEDESESIVNLSLRLIDEQLSDESKTASFI